MKELLKSKLFFRSASVVVALILAYAVLAHFLNAIYVPAILMYHSVGEKCRTLDGYGRKLNVDTETFARQMRFLHDHNYNVIPVAVLAKKIRKHEKIPHNTIAITFDDGLENNFVNAYPILKKYGLPATIFVTTNFIGKKNFITWENIRILQNNNISVESHTASHNWLPDMDAAELRGELLGSKKILEKNTGHKIEMLSYPLGGFNELTQKVARESGYVGAVATNPGRKSPKDDPYALKRIRISATSNNMFVFWGEISGYYTFIKEIRDSD